MKTESGTGERRFLGPKVAPKDLQGSLARIHASAVSRAPCRARFHIDISVAMPMLMFVLAHVASKNQQMIWNPTIMV